jgi:ceramide glucosyltransferase
LVALQSAQIAIYLRRRSASLMAEAQPFPLSVLKPLKGADEGLYENLRAIVTQRHPHFEVIFGAEAPDDPGLTVARKIARDFPQVSIKIITGAFPFGMNPKVRLLRSLMEHASHEWILISDSNVRPLPGYLRELQSRQVETKADLVHSVLSGVGGKSLGGRLEELHLNGWVAASICLADRLSHACVIGKSMLLRRTALEDIGGFGAVEDILAEDYITGALLQKHGKIVALSGHRLPVMTGNAPLSQFVGRHVRWGQMRRHIAPLFFLLELSANPTPFLLALSIWGGPEARTVALVAQAFKWSVDAVCYMGHAVAPSGRTLLLIPFKDILVPLMWAVSLVKKTVSWRGHRMLVGPGSRLVPMEERAPAVRLPTWQQS